MSRGNRRGAIYHDDADRRAWLKILALVCERHRCIIHGYCQMTNHYHLLVETTDANLGQLMGQLNGRYARYVNWRHDLVGHVFQGRYKAILVQKASYLLQLSRYIALNPLRGKIVSSLDDWPWSSYPYFIGAPHSPTWLERNWLLGQFGSTGIQASAQYRNFVLGGVGGTSPLAATRHQVLLGDDVFVSQYQHLECSDQLDETVKNARGAVVLPLLDFQAKYADRNEAMARAYLSTAHTMPQIAHAFGVSTKTVSRAVAAYDESTPDQ